MKNRTVLMKVLFVAAPVALVMGGLSIYATKRAFSDDPELVPKIETAIKSRYDIKNFQINFNEGSQNTSISKLSGEVKSLEVKSVNGDVKITQSASDEIVVRASSDSNQSHRVLKTTFEDGQLEVKQVSEIGSDTQIEIEIPKNFNGPILVKTVGGDVDLKDLTPSKIEIASVSGDVRLELKTAREEYIYDFKTVSGEINNRFIDNKHAKKLVIIKTVSGDIEVK